MIVSVCVRAHMYFMMIIVYVCMYVIRVLYTCIHTYSRDRTMRSMRGWLFFVVRGPRKKYVATQTRISG